MSKDKINMLTHDLAGFFTNNRSSFYRYKKQRELYAQQDVLYNDTQTVFKAVCLSFSDLNTPAVALAPPPPPPPPPPAPTPGPPPVTATGSSPSNTPDTTAGANTSIAGSMDAFQLNMQLASMGVRKIEKMTIKIRFIEDDAHRNGIITEDPLTSGVISEAYRESLIQMHPSAIVLDLGVIPNHQDILLVRQDTEGKYYVEKIIGNLMGIIPPTTPGVVGLVQIMQMGGFPLGGLLAPTSLGKNQALNYTPANRVQEKKINLIILHSTAGATGAGKAQACINFFAPPFGPSHPYRHPVHGKNPPCSKWPNGDWPRQHDGKEIVCHPTHKYLVKKVTSSIHYATDQGGAVVQGVLEKDLAHHLGRGAVNARSIGIEMCGFPNELPGQGADGKYCKMYNKTILETTAKLCAEICARYNIPVKWLEGKSPSGSGIAGHDQYAPSIRCDPGWILNKHQNSRDVGGEWHLARWSSDDKARADQRGLPFKLGELKYPEGNYWDWEDFIERVQKYHSALSPTSQQPNQSAPQSMADTDGDGLLNTEEDFNKNNIVDPGEKYVTNPDMRDTDGDGTDDNLDLDRFPPAPSP